ncbi:MAG: hypothetical protein GY723_13445 [bacterium]|nr:hypothetical protein [bacterium]MCP5068590.1 hypothetical protein [bacterium]
MSKYYVLMFLIMGIALLYAFLEDPCNRQLRADFSREHPSFEILDSGASEGSPESVRCHISYREPENEQVYKDVWVYQNTGDGWTFFKVAEARQTDQTDGVEGQPSRSGDPEASSEGADLFRRLEREDRYASLDLLKTEWAY